MAQLAEVMTEDVADHVIVQFPTRRPIPEWGQERLRPEHPVDSHPEVLAMRDRRDPMVRLEEDIAALMDEWVSRMQMSGDGLEVACLGCRYLERMGMRSSHTTVRLYKGRGSSARFRNRRRRSAGAQMDLLDE